MIKDIVLTVTFTDPMYKRSLSYQNDFNVNVPVIFVFLPFAFVCVPL